MSYQVLARQWRPRSFQQMVGQEHILRMLTNALTQQRLHHAYLFTGTRGVGKTTLARILAKCLNCENGVTALPCGACGPCKNIDAGRFLDLYEIDAASRTKVEDTRELLENVHYQPAEGRYKVYLIDEAHMLSGHSFNALLKTLEEPPPYVKFILATTEPKKLPITILSRCLQFHLKHVPKALIAEHLKMICETETILYEETALTQIAEAADGSVRDALSLLDLSIAYSGQQPITLQDTRKLLGSVEQDRIYQLLNALAKQDAQTIIDQIAELAQFTTDFNRILEAILSTLHQVSIAQILPDAREQDEMIKTLANLFTPEETQLYYQIALIGRRDLPLAPSGLQGFEMVMLRMLTFKPGPAPIEKIEKTEKVSAAVPQKAVKPPVAPSPTLQNWTEVLPKLELTGMAQALASSCILETLTTDKVVLILSVQHQPMHNKKLAERIEQALQRYLQAPIKLEIRIVTNEINTPTKQLQQAEADRQKGALQTLQNDRGVQEMIETFDATLDIDSIKVF